MDGCGRATEGGMGGMAAGNRWWRKLPGVNYLSCLLLRCDQTKLVSRHPLKSKETNGNSNLGNENIPKTHPEHPANSTRMCPWDTCSKVLLPNKECLDADVEFHPAMEFCRIWKIRRNQGGLFSSGCFPPVVFLWLPRSLCGGFNFLQMLW